MKEKEKEEKRGGSYKRKANKLLTVPLEPASPLKMNWPLLGPNKRISNC